MIKTLLTATVLFTAGCSSLYAADVAKELDLHLIARFRGKDGKEIMKSGKEI